MELTFWFDIVGAWVAVGMTLAVLSFLYRDNPLFKFSEHLYVGVSMGYLVVRAVYDNLLPKAWDKLVAEVPDYWVLIPSVMGVLLLLRYVPKMGWLSRFAFAFLMGTVSGMAIPRFITANILHQAQATVHPLVGHDAAGTFWGLDQLNAFLILLGVVTVLIYFLFSVERKGPVSWLAQVGTFFLMATFGTAFGLTVMGRVTLLIGRFDDLQKFGTTEYSYATPILLAIVLAILVVWSVRNPVRPEGGPAVQGPA